MKLFICFAVLSFAALSLTFDFEAGYYYPDNPLLYKGKFQRKPAYIVIVTDDFHFPPENQPRIHQITYIKATDKNDSFSYAEVIAGGVFYNFTVMRFHTGRTTGYNYELEIYGRNETTMITTKKKTKSFTLPG